MMQTLAKWEKIYQTWEKNNVDTLPWIRRQQQYCLADVPFEQLPSFPLFTAIASILSFFVSFFALKFVISPLFPQYRKLKEADKEKWNVKIVSMLHAIFVFQGAVRGLYAWTPTNDNTYDLQCGYVTDLSRWYEAVTLGYMFYDFWVSVRAYGFTWEGVFPSLMIHHINILICFAIGLKFNMGFYFTLAFMTNEMSQPFLHTSWIFSKIGFPDKHPITVVNSLLLLTTWMGSRFFFNLYILYHLAINNLSWSPLNALGIGGYAAFVHVGCNVYWCYLMMKQVVGLVSKLLRGKKPASAVATATDNVEKPAADKPKKLKSKKID